MAEPAPDSSTIGVVDSSKPSEEAVSFCGDGKIDPNIGEQCDGDNLGGASCLTLRNEQGTLGCAENCLYDESMCYSETMDAGLQVGEESGVADYGG
ncbi:MAG: hypothetical protein JXA30_16920 [Deltaproteobacteria bacterium]|nr:hypothetical protein [Deltaproteobacteria bacterium]